MDQQGGETMADNEVLTNDKNNGIEMTNQGSMGNVNSMENGRTNPSFSSDL